MRYAWVAALAACYDAHALPGSPCGTDAACPNGQTCVANRCLVDGETMLDATVPHDVGTDAAAHDASAVRPAIEWNATTNAIVSQGAPATTLTITRPNCPVTGVLVAAIAMGDNTQSKLPVYTAPMGWTLVRRSDRAAEASLAVYTRVVASEPNSYTWIFDAAIEGQGWISCYVNVDNTSRIDVEIGGTIEQTGPTYTAPTLITTQPNELALAMFVAHTSLSDATTWTIPTNTVSRIAFSNGTTRSAVQGDRVLPQIGTTGVIKTTASETQDYAIAELLVLRQAP